MYIVSRIDPHYPERRHDRLWLLVGGGPDFHDGARAFHLGLDRGRERDDLAGRTVADVAEKHGLDLKEARAALAEYRSSIAALE